MNEQEKKRQPRWMMWLLYAVIVTALVSTATISRYMTSVTGSGTATVAGFSFNGAFQSEVRSIDVAGMTPGATKTTVFTVSNFTDTKASDVTQNYTIEIATTGNLPLVFALTPDTGNGYATEHVAGTGTALNSWTGGRLPHTTRTIHTYNLTVSWPAEKNDPKYSYEVDAVTLTIHSKQAD